MLKRRYILPLIVSSCALVSSAEPATNNGFSFAPGLLIAMTYHKTTPDGEHVNKYYPEAGIDVDFSYTIHSKHTFSVNSTIGGGAPSGALPITYAALGTAYQYGMKRTGLAIGPSLQATTAGAAIGIKSSMNRFTINLFGYPKKLLAATLSYSLGRLK
jgi:hypothetical protein